MAEFKPYSKIDEASKKFVDPIILSQILLRQKVLVAGKKDNLLNLLKYLKEQSVEALKKNKILYTIIKSLSGDWIYRLIVAGTRIISVVYENKEGIQLTGLPAYNSLFKEIYPQNPTVKYNLGSIDIDLLPEPFKKYIEESIMEKQASKPPHVWINKVLYDIYIEKLVTDKGAYMYVFLGRDKFEHRYAVKIPREKTIEGKPLAVSTNSSAIEEVIKGVLNSLEIASTTRSIVRKELLTRGYDEYYASQLVKYKKYILKPKAIIMLRNVYTEEEYIESPPMILEEYADLGDLEAKIRKSPINIRELIFLGVRLSGALALTHVNHFVHMDVKPQNILLITDESEPYGYAPNICDFVGIPHLFDSIVELRKSTPEYADPISLIKGRTTYNYDVYGLGIILYYALTGKKLKSRILLNLMTLKNMYGAAVPLRVFLVENPDLVAYAKRIDVEYKEYMRNKKKKPSESFIQDLLSIIEDYDREQLRELDQKLPSNISKIIKRMLSFDETTRYPDALALWIELVDTVKDLGYSNLLP